MASKSERKSVADFPELVAQWHPTKNGEVTPDQVGAGSNKKYWWKCPVAADHEWQAVASSRVKGNGCAACRGFQGSTTNSLGSLFPDVAAQWHPTRNGDLTPHDLSAGSGKKVWWKCGEGPDHEWQANVNNRTKGTGCPACAGQQVSITNALTSRNPEIAAEWHLTKNGEVAPSDVTSGSNKKVWWKCSEGPDHEWNAAVAERTKRGQGCPSCAGKQVSITNSLASLYPEVAAQWHPTKNGQVTPDRVVAGSTKKYWWKCVEGSDHEWQAGVSSRTRRTGCPACAGLQVSLTNSLASLFPAVAAEWHPTKNGALRPSDLAAGTSRKVWWKCPKSTDHEWQAGVSSRTRGTGCPACRGLQVSITNSLTSLFSEVAAEWHPTRNGEVTPDQVTAGSNKKFWWKCPESPDHEWPGSPAGRTRGGRGGCPFCNGLRLSVTNRLDLVAPELAAEWHPTKNGDLKPSELVAGSGKTVWWKCPQGPDHEWQTRAVARYKGKGCPYCANVLVSVTNSLNSCAPEVAAQWHPTRNGEATPDQVIAGSHKKYWWKCIEGSDHEWVISPGARLGSGDRTGTGCPYCTGKAVSVTNSLATSFPEIATQWHPSKNKGLTPAEVVAGSAKKFWWKCPKGSDHEWRASGDNRTKTGQGCPYCANHKVSSTNNLAACNPALAKQWHPTRNGTLKPEGVISGAGKRAWWKCPEGPDHEWNCRVVERSTKDRGCPFCAGQKVSVTNSLATLHPELSKEWHPTKNRQLTPSSVTSGTGWHVWWSCSVNPEHEWSAVVSSRTGGSFAGCPYCHILPRSRQEIRLAFELAYHLPVDHEMHKVKVEGKLWDVDICLPEKKLLIEFDGEFWHREKADKDKAKAKHLRKAGWTVVRVREEPLKKLSKWNVVVPFNADADVAATLVLQHLQSVCGIEIPRMDERLAADGPLCADQAEEYIQKLLAEKEAAL